MPLPTDFIAKYRTLLGPDSEAFFAALDQPAQSGFRFNPLKPNAEAVREQWITPHFQPSPYADEGYFGTIHGHTPLHQSGYVYSQEPSATLVATIAAAKPGERVLDLCAAPGGKTTQLATSMRDTGLLVANEIIPKRASILSENVERWGLTHTLVTNHAPAELEKVFPHFFDCVVVDAPCSGEGMFRKNPQAQAEWTLDTPLACAQRQQEILAAAVQMIKPGGRLIYSTCTFAPEEDEAIISTLVEKWDFQITPLDLTAIPHANGHQEWGRVTHLNETLRLWPHQHPGEGHFVAALTAPTTPPSPQRQARPWTATAPTASQRELLREVTPFLPEDKTLTFHVIKDELWAVPNALPQAVQTLRLRRWGLHVGTFKKKRFIPNFALAMALKTTDHLPTQELNSTEWRQYVHGEALPKPGNAGWLLLTYQGMPVGFGKQVQQLIKNFYPKGLRFTADETLFPTH